MELFQVCLNLANLVHVSGNVNQKATRVEAVAAVAPPGAMGPNQAAGPREFHAGYMEIRACAGEIHGPSRRGHLKKGAPWL